MTSMNVSGAITSNEDGQSGTRDILFPNQVEDVDEIAVDIGGTLAKVTYFSRKKGSTGGRLHFHRFTTESIHDFISFVGSIIHDGDNSTRIKKIQATGGGAHKYFDLLSEKLGVEVVKEDEMRCLITGLNFLLKQVSSEVFTYVEGQPLQFEDVKTPDKMYPYMLVNIGSGVSMLKVTGENQFERISGTSLGGGTLWGLLRLVTDCKDFDEMLKLSTSGDNKNVDMLVGDIYGTDYSSVGLKATTIASSFGKLFRKDQDKSKVRPEDIAKSALFMISNNIGQIAYLNAVIHNIKSIYFGGSFIRGHVDTMRTISYGVDYWSKGTMKALFLRHDGYLGCLGALSRIWLQPETAQPSFEENFAKSFSSSPVGSLGVLDTVPEPLVTFPLLADPSSYDPDTISLKEPSLRNYWLSVFDRSIPTTSKALLVCLGDTPAIREQLDSFEKAFKSMITKLRTHPDAYGQLSIRSLLNLKEQCLHEFVSKDPYKQIKDKENEAALKLLGARLSKLDSLTPPNRIRDIVDGVLAGNMFDWGAKDVMDLLIKGEISFDSAGNKINRPGLVDNYQELETALLHGEPYKKVFIFLDNSGADTILGVIPLARELLRMGTPKVILAANSTPALNDITHQEVMEILPEICGIDTFLKSAYQDHRISSLSTGSGSPCLNLLRVTETCSREAETADLVIVVGMGRAIHTNFHVHFRCDSLKLAVIKNESVAHFLGGTIFDAICDFQVIRSRKRKLEDS